MSIAAAEPFEPRHSRGAWIAITLVVALTRLVTIPQTLHEFDETLFVRGVIEHDPWKHHPPPPGYPLFMAVGKLFALVIGDPFVALVALSTISSIIGFVVLARAFGAIAGDPVAGICGSLLFYFSPAMLVHSTPPISDTGALALLAAAFLMSARLLRQSDGTTRDAVLLGLFAAAAVGWRPQFSILILPFGLMVFLLAPGMRKKLVLVTSFTAGCLAWLIPLVIECGGVAGFLRFEGGQAGYFASHDADVSRTGWSAPMLVMRFVAHPWGPKLLSAPLLGAVVAGALTAALRRRREELPLIVAGATYLAFCLYFMDPADGVRYSLPATIVAGYLAGVGVGALKRVGVRRWPAVAFAIVVVYAIGSASYVATLIRQRVLSPSPTVAAAAFAQRTYGSGAVALYELPLWPHAMYLLSDFSPRPVAQGMNDYFNRADVPLFIYADGAARERGAVVFRWKKDDAYSKLTRDHYAFVSIIPLPIERRFKALEGVEAIERVYDGESWRWLRQQAQLELPPVGASSVRLVLGLPRESSIDANRVVISVDGVLRGTVAVRRDGRATVELPVSPRGSVIQLRAERAFTPAADVSANNRDPRALALQLYELEQLTPPAAFSSSGGA